MKSTEKSNFRQPEQRVDRVLCGADVIYSYYPFLSADAISQLVLEDVRYLERLGCYRLPSRASLDEFVKAYFRYIHPHQPILDEGDFWRAYTSTSAMQTMTISIFVFQAMLFAACSFVPSSTIDQLGFSDFQTARATFYRRAKALFHIDSYRDTLFSAQGALLLTQYVSASDAKVNTYWLSNAIYFARSANVQRHEGLNKASVPRWSQLERLWCCCLLRDRLLALGLRRHMQIGTGEGILSRVEEIILHTKAEESMVYDTTTKQALARSFSASCGLAALLRQALGILSLDPTCSGSGEMTMAIEKVKACSDRLDQWFAKAKASCSIDGSADKSVILQNNIAYIYYHSAKIALWNHAIYVSITKGCPVHIEFPAGGREVETAIHGIDASLQQIAEHGMLSFMPIAIVAHIAMPLVWHILNIKLDRRLQLANTRKRLSVYLSTLNVLKERYEGVERVLHHIRQTVTCLDVHETPRSLSLDIHALRDFAPNNSDRADSFTSLPRFFLRTMLIVEQALAKGQYPEEHELPRPLGFSEGSNAHSTCTCIANGCWDLPDLGDAFDAMLEAMSPVDVAESKRAENPYSDGRITIQKPESLESTANLDEFPDFLNDLS
ncbi:uncharacterized protein Z519_01857 [Cladophialophora bantiana CBS 173.52]|uniref:Xylanolytic transcriptional activator regulatory domain-containing protein n=1 Tax=Cladophialophora bantiana (strain ATCC 10958 / CBS 173.52 / CDC B-1940 / NIH 8579) TaxID=1442370 RepID=A0A0D2HXX2_CLAB1|nr:uncharacterized protein Z519_01857 [Cladophialophora bantiana CBS 173.52]KIW98273.1 hypothetical protein Z519_01857 [Cladophialophora bantiana CBS 173.52]